MSTYTTFLGRRFLDPPDQEGFIAWLEAGPLTPGVRVQLKKDWEFETGIKFPESAFNRIRGANQGG